MAELRLTGPTEDGDGLRLADAEGTEHSLPFSVFLRRLVLEHGDGEADGAEPGPGTPSPRSGRPGDGPDSGAGAPHQEHAVPETSGPGPLAPRIDPPLLPGSVAPEPGAPAPAGGRPASSPPTPLADQEDVRAAAAQEAPPMSPREIQQRIRAGASVEQVARESGNSFARIRSYGFPVLAERSYVAQQARSVEIWVGGPDLYAGTVADGGPSSLGELVEHRLRELGVDVSGLAWDAWREPSGSWTVTASFDVADDAGLPTAERPPARWAFRPAGHHLDPANRWARLLSDAAAWDVFSPGDEAEAEGFGPVAPEDVPADAGPAVDAEPSVTPLGTRGPAGADPDADLLEILRARRGRRVGADAESDDALAHVLAREAATRDAGPTPREPFPPGPAGPASEAPGVEDPDAADDRGDEDGAAEAGAGDAEAPRRGAAPRSESPRPAPARRLRALPTSDAEDGPVDGRAAGARDGDRPAAPTATPAPSDSRTTADPEDAPSPQSPDPQSPTPPSPRMPVPRPRSRTTGRRASVPSWDDIVFGRKGD